MVGIGEQLVQDVELPGGHGDLHPVQSGGQAVRVQHQAAHRQPPAGLNIGPPQQRPHPHEQLTEVDGLYHVVINAQIKPLLLGRQVIPRGHKQDGDGFVQSPDGLGKLKSICAGHHDVRDDQVIELAVHGVIGRPGAEAAPRLIAAVVEIGAGRLVQLWVVIHHKNSDHGYCPPVSYCSVCRNRPMRQSV